MDKLLKHVKKKNKKKDPRYLEAKWCFNLEQTGGCTSQNVTQDFLNFVATDKKSQKILSAAKP